MKHQHLTPCSCVGTCGVVVVTEWDAEDDSPEEWFAEMYQHIATRKGMRDRVRVAWAVLRGRDPYTHGICLQHEEIVGLRDFLNERTAA